MGAKSTLCISLMDQEGKLQDKYVQETVKELSSVEDSPQADGTILESRPCLCQMFYIYCVSLT